MQINVIWKRFGVRAACHTLIYKLAQRCLVLDVTHLMVLDISQVAPVWDLQAEYRPLSYGEIVGFSQAADLELEPRMANRTLGELDVCFGAIIDGKLAAYYWLAFNSIEAIHNSAGSEDTGVSLSFPDDTAFAYKAFVHPDYRGRGIYTQMVHLAVHWAAQHRNIRQLVSTADWTNYAALRSCRRQGKRSLGLVWRFGLPGYMFTLGPKVAGNYGVALGKCAQPTTRPLHHEASECSGIALRSGTALSSGVEQCQFAN